MRARNQIIVCLVLLMGMVSGCNVSSDNPTSLRNHSLDINSAVVVKELNEEYGIEVVYNSSSDFFESLFGSGFNAVDKNDSAELRQCLETLAAEIRKYPSGFMKKIGLQRIVLCKDLKSNGVATGGVANRKSNTIHLNFLRQVRQGRVPGWDKNTIHHEVYHVFDRNIIGRIPGNDNTWSDINEENFRYHKLNFSDVRYLGDVFHPQPGFVSKYAMFSQREDKAETFASLMVEEEAYKIKYWCKSDKILSKKVEHIKNQIMQHSNSMNEAFWEKLVRQGFEKASISEYGNKNIYLDKESVSDQQDLEFYIHQEKR